MEKGVDVVVAMAFVRARACNYHTFLYILSSNNDH